MPVAARVVRRPLVVTRGTYVEVAAERRGSALLDVEENAALLPAERMLGLQRATMLTHDLCDVETRAPGVVRQAGHGLRRLEAWQEVEGAGRALDLPGRDARVPSSMCVA
jgi:hypothetical protein